MFFEAICTKAEDSLRAVDDETKKYYCCSENTFQLHGATHLHNGFVAGYLLSIMFKLLVNDRLPE